MDLEPANERRRWDTCAGLMIAWLMRSLQPTGIDACDKSTVCCLVWVEIHSIDMSHLINLVYRVSADRPPPCRDRAIAVAS
jgi:hypothetical protein